MSYLRGEAPDLRRLDEVPGVSHPDLYGAYPEVVRTRVEERAVDGRITLQDLVDIKIELARRAGVRRIRLSSRLETCLAFMRAGGELRTETVDAEAVLTLLAGRWPEVDAFVKIDPTGRAFLRCDWSAFES